MNGYNDLAIYSINIAIVETMRISDPAKLLELVETGGDPNIFNEAGWTPIIFMTSIRDLKGVKRLIEAGSNINHQENDGWTALIFAVAINDNDTIKFLLEQGADSSLVTKDGRTALSIAEKDNNLDLVELLQKSTQKEGSSVTDKDLGTTDKDTTTHVHARAEYSKLAKERAAKEIKAREQAEREASSSPKEEPKKKSSSSSIFSLFGI